MTETAKQPARTQQQRRTEARDRLIQAAAELIAEGGFASLTLASVGARAGYSRGIANHHFGSKAQLVTELVDHVEREFVAATAPAQHLDDPVAALQQVTRAFFKLLGDIPATHRAFLVLWAGAVTGDDELRSRMNASDAAFRAALAATIRRRGVDADATAAMLLGTLRGVAIQHLLAPDALRLHAVEQSIRRTIRQAVGA